VESAKDESVYFAVDNETGSVYLHDVPGHFVLAECIYTSPSRIYFIQSIILSLLFMNMTRVRVSSGSIVSDYGLDDRTIGVRSPAGAKDFSSSLCLQTGSVAHPASCTMDPGGKARPGRDADHSPTSSAEVVNE
jgi:hypothetical protein